jgi:5-methylthioadenosine/S-adenosylhomocysteine deaminase
MLRARERMTPDDHRLAARWGALRALRAGTTTLADSGPAGTGASAMTEAGLRGRVHLEVFGREEGPEAARRAAATAERVAALDEDAGPRVAVGLSPHSPYTVGPGFWTALAAEPGMAGRPWATHLAESEDEDRAIAAGDGPLAALFADAGFVPGHWEGPQGASPVARVGAVGGLRAGMVAAHCVRLGDGDPERLVAAGVGVAHCPRSNAHLRCGTAPVAALRAAGVALGLGTDSPASGGDYDLRAEARSRAAGDAEGALRMITLDAARALAMDADVGALTTGRRADLVAIRPAGPADDPAGAVLDGRASVALVVVDGEALVEDDRPYRIDGDALVAAADGARKRLW